MDLVMGWMTVLVGVLGLAFTREEAVFGVTLAILGARPLLGYILPERIPRWPISTILSVVAFCLPWPVAERWTLIFALAVIQYAKSVPLRLGVTGASLMIVAGQSKLNATFVTTAATWVSVILVWLSLRQRALRARRQAQRPLRVADVVRLGLQIGLTVLLGGSVAHFLPVVERWAVERAMDMAPSRQTGFSTRTDLNSVDSIKDSSEVALRIRGQGPMLMRGQAYGTYNMGIWTSAREGTVILPPAPPAGLGPAIRVTSAVDSNRIAFAPLEWGTIEAPHALGQDSCRVVTAHEPLHLWELRTLRLVASPLTAEERTLYLQVTPRIKSDLGRLLAPHLRAGMNDRQKLGALLYMLGEKCEYSLAPGAPKGEEPIVRFLTVTHKGHCEYFASAMTLLARLCGIPCRYVTGFSATRTNKFGGYLMARDSDAHAWVEAWVPGEGWTSWDPTPSVWQQHTAEESSGFGDYLRELLDYLDDRWETLLDALSQHVLRPIGAWFKRQADQAGRGVVLLLVLGLSPWWGRPVWRRLKHWFELLAGRFRARPVVTVPEEGRAAATALSSLEQLLEPHGVTRGPAVTMLELERRLEPLRLSEEARSALRELVDQFCRFRYGGGAWDQARAAGCLSRLTSELTRRPAAH